jgi:hypothetical protein
MLAAIDTLHVGFGLGPSFLNSIWSTRILVGFNCVGMLYFYIQFTRNMLSAISSFRSLAPTRRRIEIKSIKLELRSLGIEADEMFAGVQLKSAGNIPEHEP